MKKSSMDLWITEKIKQVFHEKMDAQEVPSDILKKPLAEQIKVYQVLKIRETLKYAQENSSFYNELYQGIDVDNIRSLDDLRKVPFTSSEDVKNHGMKMLCTKPDEISRIVTLDTSGTKDLPKRIFFTEKDQELTIDFFHNGMRTLVSPEDVHLILLPCSTPGSVGDLLQQGLDRLGAKVIAKGPFDSFEEIAQVIEREKVNSLTASPGQALGIAKYMEIKGQEAKVDAALLSTDYLPKEAYKELERIWGCKVFDHYGMTEMGLGVAVACEAEEGCHMRDGDIYFEIVDTEGNLLEDGSYGEVVFTTLTREGMPFIRYKTGDIGKTFIQQCPCGSEVKRIECTTYRIEDCIRIEDALIYIGLIDELICSQKGMYAHHTDIAYSEDIWTFYVKAFTPVAGKDKDTLNTKEHWNIASAEDIYDAFYKNDIFGKLIKKGKIKLDIDVCGQEAYGMAMLMKKKFGRRY